MLFLFFLLCVQVYQCIWRSTDITFWQILKELLEKLIQNFLSDKQGCKEVDESRSQFIFYFYSCIFFYGLCHHSNPSPEFLKYLQLCFSYWLSFFLVLLNMLLSSIRVSLRSLNLCSIKVSKEVADNCDFSNGNLDLNLWHHIWLCEYHQVSLLRNKAALTKTLEHSSPKLATGFT